MTSNTLLKADWPRSNGMLEPNRNVVEFILSVRLEILYQNDMRTKHWWKPNKIPAATVRALLKDLANKDNTVFERILNFMYFSIAYLLYFE